MRRRLDLRRLDPRPTTVALLAVGLLLGERPAAGQELRADRIEADAGRIEAEGRVRLEMGSCSLSANGLSVVAGTSVELAQPCATLAGGGEVLRADHLVLARDGSLRARWLKMALCGCPTATLPLKVAARRAWIAPGGDRLHLTWPVVHLGPIPVFALPYVGLPLHPGVSGILPPHLGYSGRDGLRVAQGGYIAWGPVDIEGSAGWVQRRGGQARLQIGYRGNSRGSARYTLRGLRDGDRWRGWWRGRGWIAGGHWGVWFAPQLVSDRRLLAQLAHQARAVFAPFSASRLLLRVGWGPLAVAAVGDVYQQLRDALERQTGALGRGALQVQLRPLVLWRVAMVHGYARVDQLWAPGASFSDRDGDRELDRGELLSRGTAIRLAPTVTVGSRLGPVHTSLSAGYRLRALRSVAASVAPDAVGARHGAMLAAEAGLPLSRTFSAGSSRVRHVIEPLVGWRSFVEIGSRLPPALLFDELLFGGHYGQAGVRTRLLVRRGQGPVRELGVAAVRFLLSTSGDHLVSGDLKIGPVASLRADVRAVFDVARRKPAWLSAQLCADRGPLGVCAGYLRQRLRDTRPLIAGADLVGPASLTSWRALSHTADQLYGRVTAAIGPLSAEGAIYGDPTARVVTHAVYGVALRDRCDCLRIALRGYSRVGQRVPDVVLQFGWRPRSGARGCLAGAGALIGGGGAAHARW